MEAEELEMSFFGVKFKCRNPSLKTIILTIIAFFSRSLNNMLC
ncbi:hypothetical protein SAMN04488132_102525 [Sediminibacterium ginsengisoli]|uniref:Uncharacterized protein n=1 Tax=Sediminibacterium ginsengisoli TaxID=413434 RepID=A0A1T4LJ68_9BACT|nr:hypothetical protein SAMN04488132_102525 [Sediminibacterium ginsengisoli]